MGAIDNQIFNDNLVFVFVYSNAIINQTTALGIC